jgi:crotonobetainyl-CoA:carnitine CoA-transferase CaiB-like acyl-CoA transferase
MSLAGVTVIDLTRYLPGPYCTRLLADLGATVIKVEMPSGDPMRGVDWYDLLNRGKQIVEIDLASPKGRLELDELLARAGVCVEGFRPSTARALGVDGATLRARHPKLVHCSISGYGQQGPGAERAGHDLNYQAEAGLLDAVPRMPPLLVADITAGLHATIAILAALVAQRGVSIDVSLLKAAGSWMPFVPPPKLRGDFACYNLYETSDGAHVALGALEAKFWARFCTHAGRGDWIADQFAPDPRRAALVEEVRTLFLSRDAEYWARELLPLDLCVSIVQPRR